MPKRILPLTDIQARNAKPADKEYKLSDGGGLYLLVTPTGGKLWNLKYRYNDKEKRLSLGSYPIISLSDARKLRDDAKKLLANGVDPGDEKKARKAAKAESCANSFEAIAREWCNKFFPNLSKSNTDKIKARLENDLFPWIGSRPISEITPPELLSVLRRIESRGAVDTAHRVRQNCGQIFRYAIATGRADRDISADLRGALPPPKKSHFAAMVDPKEVATLLRAFEGYSGTFPVKCALKLAPLVFLRPGELRHAEWQEFDLEAAEWNVPIEKMKLIKRIKEARKGEKHLVPLSRQAVEILKELQPLTGRSRYVFPSSRTLSRPMSENTVNAALRRMGFDTKEEMTGHGFRAMARTILDEVLQFRPDIIECQLAHKVKDANGRAYNRTSFLPDRRKMMQTWSDYLDGLKAGAKVIPLKRVEGE